MCKGLGEISEIDISKIISNTNLSIRDGGIIPIGKYKPSVIFWQLESIAIKHKTSLDIPIKELPDDFMEAVLYGVDYPISLDKTPLGRYSGYKVNYEGIIEILKQHAEENSEGKAVKKYFKEQVCTECNGARLKKESLNFKINNKTLPR